jgi:hypothetical protein
MECFGLQNKDGSWTNYELLADPSEEDLGGRSATQSATRSSSGSVRRSQWGGETVKDESVTVDGRGLIDVARGRSAGVGVASTFIAPAGRGRGSVLPAWMTHPESSLARAARIASMGTREEIGVGSEAVQQLQYVE